MDNNKLKSIFNLGNKREQNSSSLTTLKNNKPDDFSISRKRVHQKMVAYEVEILESKMKRKFEELGERIYHCFQAGKRIQKTSKELAPVLKDLHSLEENLKEKKAEEKDFNFSLRTQKNKSTSASGIDEIVDEKPVKKNKPKKASTKNNN